jgi:hypothetical protein
MLVTLPEPRKIRAAAPELSVSRAFATAQVSNTNSRSGRISDFGSADPGPASKALPSASIISNESKSTAGRASSIAGSFKLDPARKGDLVKPSVTSGTISGLEQSSVSATGLSGQANGSYSTGGNQSTKPGMGERNSRGVASIQPLPKHVQNFINRHNIVLAASLKNNDEILNSFLYDNKIKMIFGKTIHGWGGNTKQSYRVDSQGRVSPIGNE